MPIHLYIERSGVTLNGPDADDWDLPTQLDKLHTWVAANRDSLNEGPYVADIGFMVREGASGGGAVLTPEAMQMFVDANITIYFSEYIGVNE